MTAKQITAFVCPLDWGLGHASRLIPVVNELQRCGYHIMLGGNGKSLSLLQQEFPSLPYRMLPSFTPRYASGSVQVPKLLLQIPRMLYSIVKEHRQLQKLMAIYSFDLVISDNRYGLFCRKASTVLITHQISPILPKMLRWMEYILHRMICLLIRRFDACWIPDLPSPMASLSGRLSHRYRMPPNSRFIGLLSRFTNMAPHTHHSIPTPTPNTQTHAHTTHTHTHTHSCEHNNYSVVVVLSGPEPQRTILFDMLLPQIRATGMKTLIICGLTDEGPGTCSERNAEDESRHDEVSDSPVTCVPHLPADAFLDALIHATVILCRPGYSGLMDLAAVGRTAILIPTPGQSEQEYLAEYLAARYGFACFAQQDFSLEEALKVYQNRRVKSLLPFPAGGTGLLNMAIRQLHKKDQHDGQNAQQKT